MIILTVAANSTAVFLSGCESDPTSRPRHCRARRRCEGDARLEVDFSAANVHVDFTIFDNGRADMSWSGLAVDCGEFGDGDKSICGAFYRADHAGAAGTLVRAGLTGVFGALRTSQ